jgi:HNH endonuclease
MARGRADIANTALRIFLQEMGAAYDEERGLKPYNGTKDFAQVREFFENRCCYCGANLADTQAAQDHLIPMNKAALGLHAWGNIVPACSSCNAKKQGKEWHAFLASRAGADTAKRYTKIDAYVKHYKYAPTTDLRTVAEDLYTEVGSISVTLINVEVARVRDSL